MQAAIAERVDFYRLAASPKLDPKRRAGLGQYMTPAPIGRFMASLFDNLSGDLRVLDPGAGVGSLSAAIFERCCHESNDVHSVFLSCYEIEPALIDYLEETLQAAEIQGRRAGIEVTSQVQAEDFVYAHANVPDVDLLAPGGAAEAPFSHVIMKSTL